MSPLSLRFTRLYCSPFTSTFCAWFKVEAVPQTTLVAELVEVPQTTLNPLSVLVPHTTEVPQTTELEESTLLPKPRTCPTPRTCPKRRVGRDRSVAVNQRHSISRSFVGGGRRERAANVRRSFITVRNPPQRYPGSPHDREQVVVRSVGLKCYRISGDTEAGKAL